jgi:hypothetical protein
LQLTAFGAQDRSLFDGVLYSAPWPQLNGNPFGGLSIPIGAPMNRTRVLALCIQNLLQWR